MCSRFTFVDDAKATDLVRTGAFYGMVHRAALLRLLGFAQGHTPRQGVAAVAGWNFAVGIVFFQRQLVCLGADWGHLSWATPIGVAAFILGWSAVGLLAIRRG